MLVLLGAVRAGLAVLGDGVGVSARAETERIEQYLSAVLEACTAPQCDGVPVEVISALRSACAYLRAHEVADASLALHFAHSALTAVLGEQPRSPG